MHCGGEDFPASPSCETCQGASQQSGSGTFLFIHPGRADAYRAFATTFLTRSHTNGHGRGESPRGHLPVVEMRPDGRDTVTIGEVFLIAILLAGTLALTGAHRSGWLLDLWLDLCDRDRRGRSLSNPLPEAPHSRRSHHED